MKKRVIILCTILLGFFTLLTAQEQVYLFSYFTNNGRDGLHLAYSRDGLKWNTLNDGKPFLAPAVG